MPQEREVEDHGVGAYDPGNVSQGGLMNFGLNDSGQRVEFDGGMVRDTDEGKVNFDLLWIEGLPYNKQPLTRFADHMTKGALKYGKRNFEKAKGEEAFYRYRESLRRHFNQWWCGDRDEDHLAAVMFNAMALMMMESRGDGEKGSIDPIIDYYHNAPEPMTAFENDIPMGEDGKPLEVHMPTRRLMGMNDDMNDLFQSYLDKAREKVSEKRGDKIPKHALNMVLLKVEDTTPSITPQTDDSGDFDNDLDEDVKVYMMGQENDSTPLEEHDPDDDILQLATEYIGEQDESV